jgi:hypothetical protein
LGFTSNVLEDARSRITWCRTTVVGDHRGKEIVGPSHGDVGTESEDIDDWVGSLTDAPVREMSFHPAVP